MAITVFVFLFFYFFIKTLISIVTDCRYMITMFPCFACNYAKSHRYCVSYTPCAMIGACILFIFVILLATIMLYQCLILPNLVTFKRRYNILMNTQYLTNFFQSLVQFVIQIFTNQTIFLGYSSRNDILQT